MIVCESVDGTGLMDKAQQLRAHASNARAGAEYSDSINAWQRERAWADDLDRQAAALEDQISKGVCNEHH